jgi:hypothetical protein
MRADFSPANAAGDRVSAVATEPLASTDEKAWFG